MTILTQIGGLAWIIALFFKRKIIAFLCSYIALTLTATFAAPHFGREPVSCFSNGHLQVQSWLYCGLNRNYVTPKLKDVLIDVSEDMAAKFPDTKTVLLDASFPFFDGFPLLPHLSHDDGAKADLAFYYEKQGNYLPSATKSPIGYFAFEEGPSTCTSDWPTLRWNFGKLQHLWPDYSINEPRTKFLLQLLAAEKNVEKIFIEPHLKEQLGLTSQKLRFQGCRAARHDDHIHFQVFQ